MVGAEAQLYISEVSKLGIEKYQYFGEVSKLGIEKYWYFVEVSVATYGCHQLAHIEINKELQNIYIFLF